MPDEIQPPDWENPPCPACFAFDADHTADLPATPDKHTADLRMVYASGLVSGFLMCRTRSPVLTHLCPTHVEAAQAVIDAVCADLGLPRDKVYADIGIPMPDPQEKH